MTAQKYRTKKGRELFRPILTLREAQHLMIDDDMDGWCLACGESQRPVEPDAEHYLCESCRENMVFGIEQLILRGIAKVKEDEA